MTVRFRSSFARDLKKLKDESTLEAIRHVIEETENAVSLQEIAHLTKLSGYDGFYRIRIGAYRIGVYVDQETVEFVRCLSRKDIYRYFP